MNFAAATSGHVRRSYAPCCGRFVCYLFRARSIARMGGMDVIMKKSLVRLIARIQRSWPPFDKAGREE